MLNEARSGKALEPDRGLQAFPEHPPIIKKVRITQWLFPTFLTIYHPTGQRYHIFTGSFKKSPNLR